MHTRPRLLIVALAAALAGCASVAESAPDAGVAHDPDKEVRARVREASERFVMVERAQLASGSPQLPTIDSIATGTLADSMRRSWPLQAHHPMHDSVPWEGTSLQVEPLGSAAWRSFTCIHPPAAAVQAQAAVKADKQLPQLTVHTVEKVRGEYLVSHVWPMGSCDDALRSEWQRHPERAPWSTLDSILPPGDTGSVAQEASAAMAFQSAIHRGVAGDEQAEAEMQRWARGAALVQGRRMVQALRERGSNLVLSSSQDPFMVERGPQGFSFVRSCVRHPQPRKAGVSDADVMKDAPLLLLEYTVRWSDEQFWVTEVNQKGVCQPEKLAVWISQPWTAPWH